MDSHTVHCTAVIYQGRSSQVHRCWNPRKRTCQGQEFCPLRRGCPLFWKVTIIRILSFVESFFYCVLFSEESLIGGSTVYKSFILPGQSERGTQPSLYSSNSSGQKQPCRQMRIHGLCSGYLQLRGQAVPQSLYSLPLVQVGVVGDGGGARVVVVVVVPPVPEYISTGTVRDSVSAQLVKDMQACYLNRYVVTKPGVVLIKGPNHENLIGEILSIIIQLGLTNRPVVVLVTNLEPLSRHYIIGLQL